MVGRQTVFESLHFKIDHFRIGPSCGRRLAFIFSHLGSRILNENVNGGDFLAESGFDVINVQTSAQDWYQSLPEAALVAITQFISKRAYTSRVAMGSSMGGYAAIAFAARLECDIVLAYAPQHDGSIQSDPRFSGLVEGVSWRYPITADVIAASCQYNVVYDNMDHYDALHVATLRSVIPLQCLRETVLPFSGHSIIHFLVEVDQLKHVTLTLLTGGCLNIRAVRRNRRRSHQYLAILAFHLHGRRKISTEASVRTLIAPEFKPFALSRWILARRVKVLSWFVEKVETARLRRLRFDDQFYAHLYWDVAKSGINARLHYLRTGWPERRIARFRSRAARV